jgi:putative flavoprotein involved in K+ transport
VSRTEIMDADAMDVVVVGAGAAGVGMGVVLQELGVERFCLLERHEVGASFLRWPAETRLLTPSFPGQGFGAMDLNAVALMTSPGFTTEREHLSGADFARYLKGVAEHWKLSVKSGTEVHDVEALDGDGFVLRTSRGALPTRFVVWATGEFQYPDVEPIPGAELCVHTAAVPAYAEFARQTGEEVVVIGGYESGIDAAVHLAAAGKRVRVLDAASPWERRFGDPSVSLSPFTRERLRVAAESGRIELIADAEVERVEHTPDGYAVCSRDDRVWITQMPPLLATGFHSSLQLIAELFEWRDTGAVMLSESDESTRTPGLFVAGPLVQHEQAVFCFIYKFRQRFAVVANALAARLALDATPLERYRQEGMFLDDLSCCGTDCVC